MTITDPISSVRLDLEEVIAASQTLSSETDLDGLLTKMMELAMANSGAAKAVLLIRRGADWFVQARADVATGKRTVLLNRPLDPADGEADLVPELVFHHCRRSKQVMVVGDAQLDRRFAENSMIHTHRIKSMLCIPALSQGQLKAMVYLENRQMADVFTQERVEILKHLTAQFGVAVANAVLYESLNRKVRELQESNERYELAVAGSTAGIWDWDVVSKELFTSDRLKELLGFASDEVVLTVDELWNRLHPEDYPAVRRAVDKHREERIPFNTECRLQAKSGDYRWFRARGRALWDETGKAIRMAGSLTDIHHRKQAENALREGRQKLVKAGQIARMGFLDWNLKTNEMVWSSGVYDLYGIAPETPVTVEQTVDLVHPDDLEFVKEHLDMAVKGIRDYDIDHRVVRPDGAVVWVHARADLQRDEEGTPTSMLGTVVDITERKSAEEQLLESEDRLSKLLEQSPLAIAIWSPEGRLTQVNAAWMQIWDVSEEETAQFAAAYNIRTDPQLRALGTASLVEEAFAGEPVVLPPMEYSGNRAIEELGLEDIEPSTRWIQIHLHPVKNANGVVKYVVNTNMDLTDLKQAERETRDQREALARVERASSLGQLTGSIAHELNQPLTGILSTAQAGEMMIEKNQLEREELAEIMAAIAADAKRAGEVIRNLRELYREQKGESVPVDVNAVVTETVQFLHSEFIIQHIALTTAYAPSIPTVDGNRIQIQQVLVNLITNGIQAMSDTAQGDRRLHVAAAFDANEIRVWVDDCGPGIAADKIDRIFEPLATWKPGGTGMGLAISHSIIEAHGGRMWAENGPERGARVGFALPGLKQGQRA